MEGLIPHKVSGQRGLDAMLGNLLYVNSEAHIWTSKMCSVNILLPREIVEAQQKAAGMQRMFNVFFVLITEPLGPF